MHVWTVGGRVSFGLQEVHTLLCGDSTVPCHFDENI